MTKKKKTPKVEKSTSSKGPTELTDDELAKVDGGTGIGVAAPVNAQAAGFGNLGAHSSGSGGGEGKVAFHDLSFTKPIDKSSA
jgi:bacteriocin-like protein